jgi:hypothetical protein
MDEADLDATMDAGTRLLGLELRPEWRASVRQHLATNLRLGLSIAAFDLPDECDPAPVFQAG